MKRKIASKSASWCIANLKSSNLFGSSINHIEHERMNESMKEITSLIKQLSHINRINSVYFYLQIHKKNQFVDLRMKFEGVAGVYYTWLQWRRRRRKKRNTPASHLNDEKNESWNSFILAHHLIKLMPCLNQYFQQYVFANLIFCLYSIVQHRRHLSLTFSCPHFNKPPHT